MLILGILGNFEKKMDFIKKTTHESFNFDKTINPVIKSLLKLDDHTTNEVSINLITGENFVNIHEQHQVLENLVKNIIRGEIQIFKESLSHRMLVRVLFADFNDLLAEGLDFADTVAVNKDKYLKFLNMPEEHLSLVTTEFFRLWREYVRFIDYIDQQFHKYISGVHEIVKLKCPDYEIHPIENFPNTSNILFYSPTSKL